MLNKKEYNSYISSLNDALISWRSSDKYSEFPWSQDLMVLPIILQISLDIYFDNQYTKHEKLLLKIEGTMQYAKSDVDYLPEIIMGERGLVDDLYIACICIKDCLKTLDLNENNYPQLNFKDIDNLISSALHTLGENIYNKCNLYYSKL